MFSSPNSWGYLEFSWNSFLHTPTQKVHLFWVKSNLAGHSISCFTSHNIVLQLTWINMAQDFSAVVWNWEEKHDHKTQNPPDHSVINFSLYYYFNCFFLGKTNDKCPPVISWCQFKAIKLLHGCESCTYSLTALSHLSGALQPNPPWSKTLGEERQTCQEIVVFHCLAAF